MKPWAAALGALSLLVFLPRRESATATARRFARVVGFALNEDGVEPNKRYLEHVSKLILEDANARGYNPFDYFAVAMIESRYRYYAVSSSGAEGLFQQKPWYAEPREFPRYGPLLERPDIMVRAFGEKWDSKHERWGDQVPEIVQSYHDGNSGCCEPGYPYYRAWRNAYEELQGLFLEDLEAPLPVEWGDWPNDDVENYVLERRRERYPAGFLDDWRPFRI